MTVNDWPASSAGVVATEKPGPPHRRRPPPSQLLRRPLARLLPRPLMRSSALAMTVGGRQARLGCDSSRSRAGIPSAALSRAKIDSRDARSFEDNIQKSHLQRLVAPDITPAAIAIFAVIFGWQSWLVHANVRLPYGPLRWVFVSPEFHHWHHGAEREAHDHNYASVLACWDVLFRTVYLPAGRSPSRYGVEEQVPPGWIGRFVHPFRPRG